MCGKKGNGVYLIADALIWKVVQEGLEYAVSADYDVVLFGNGSTTFGDIDVPHGRVHKPDFGYKWGFRLGLGYDLPYDYWDVNTAWTRWHHSAHDSVSVDGDINPNSVSALLTGEARGRFISSFWVAKLFSNPSLFNIAKANWYLELDLIDAELGRNFYIGEHLTFRPFIGLRNGWIDQKYHLYFQAFDYFNDVPNPDVVARRITVKMRNDFWGMGGKLGVNSQWILGKGFSLYGKSALSLLKGRFKAGLLHENNFFTSKFQNNQPHKDCLSI